MTRGKQDKLYRTFTKGLITEAGFLTYPEDASIDELNTVIYRKGNRSRRAGIDFEEDSTEVPFGSTSNVTLTNEFLWRSPGDKGDLNFLVIQVGHLLHFFDMASQPISAGKKSYTYNLLTYKSPTATDLDVQTTHCHFASGKGILFVCQNFIDPLTIEYNPATDSFTATRVYVLMRDFDGVNDGYANDYEPTTLTKEHHYNLLNQGWVRPGQSGGDPIPGNGGGSSGGSTGGGSTGSGSDVEGSGYYNNWSGRVDKRDGTPIHGSPGEF
jgi:hypothetical protein